MKVSPSSVPESPAGEPPTSNDVARLAGVAQSTVSYVLNGKGRVSDRTRRRVLSAAATLNYQPNAGAQALRSRRSRVIGLMFPVHATGTEPARLRFLTAIAAACREQGYDALIVTADEGPAGLRRLADTALCDGLLVMEVKDREPLAEVTGKLRVPTLFVGVPASHESVICVARDYASAGTLCVEEVAKAGHHRLAVLSPGNPYLTALNFHRRFVRGALSAAAAAGVTTTQLQAGEFFLDLHLSIGDLLDQSPRPDAILSTPGVDTADVLSSLLLHQEVPGRTIAVVAVSDDETLARGPGGIEISQVHFSRTEVAKRAVSHLVRLIRNDTDALKVGDVDLIAPEWIPGATLRLSRSLDGVGDGS